MVPSLAYSYDQDKLGMRLGITPSPSGTGKNRDLEALSFLPAVWASLHGTLLTEVEARVQVLDQS